MGLIVTLTPGEIQHALLEGGIRQASAIENNRPDKFACSETDAWLQHVTGAACEIAVAKYLHVYWSGMSRIRSEDVYGWQVRSSLKTRRLAIRQKDSDVDRFVFVTGRIPRLEIHGWMFGFEARAIGRYDDPDHRNCPAYFVEIPSLHPIDRIVELPTF